MDSDKGDSKTQTADTQKSKKVKRLLKHSLGNAPFKPINPALGLQNKKPSTRFVCNFQIKINWRKEKKEAQDCFPLFLNMFSLSP